MSGEELFELSFACTVTERSVYIGLRHDQAEGAIERLGFGARGEYLSSLIELSLIYADMLMSHRYRGSHHTLLMYMISAIVYTGVSAPWDMQEPREKTHGELRGRSAAREISVRRLE
jgi:hypothetical protein